MRKFFAFFCVVALCFIFTAKLVAAEVTVSEIQGAMQEYINTDIDLKGGYFLINDPENAKAVQLKYEGLHEKVKYIKNVDAYYACADFRSLDGATLYDIDFWVKKHSNGELYVEKIIVHKENGKSKFSYAGYELAPLGKAAKEAGSHHAPEAHSY